MNARCYRLVFSRLREMLVAVAETATAQGKEHHGESGPSSAHRSITLFAMRHAAFAVLALFGLVPVLSDAQILPSGSHAPSVISAANGLPLVSVTKPSGAGVSLNTYSQFDVQKNGTVLNNSSVIVNTQLAGQIGGNPNFGANDAAKIIVNQVNSNNPSQLRGYVEVAGQRTAAVVIANPSGLVVDGGGFINTSRGILTTGNPLIDAAGNLTGFNVTQGNITVRGDGFNASNIHQADLIARAVQANAAIHGNTLNVITGANNVDYASLNATRVAGNGTPSGVSIDVSQLGGMYANRITLVGTENGVGVANAGTIAAQAGDLTLTGSGQLVQTGRMTASGNVGINAASVANSGTVYAQQNTAIASAGMLENSGAIAAQQGTAINAGSLESTGTLGAGVNSDGSLGNSGNLDVATTGQLSATGQNVAGGGAALTGSSVNLAGSETAANGNVSLTANSGDLNLAGATTSAGGSVFASAAAGTLDNDNGSLTGGSVALNAGDLSNRNGNISSQGPLVAHASGELGNQDGSMVSQGAMQVSGGVIANNRGILQGAAGLSVAGASLDNTAGRITSLNGDGLSVTTTGQLVNAAGVTATGAQGGVIGGNGAVTLQGGRIANHGAVTAQTNLQVSGQSLDNSDGLLAASGEATIDAGARLTNSGGTIAAGQKATVSATTLDNSAGTTQAAQVSLTATNLVNHAGTITQTGTGAMNIAISDTLDNSAGGTLQTRSTDLTLAPGALINDAGTITHAGTGTLTIAPGSGAGSLSNAGGQIVTAGQIAAQAGSLNNTGGVLAAQGNIAANIAGEITNTQGAIRSLASLSLAGGGALTNTHGQIQSGTGTTGDASTLAIRAASTDNTDGLIGNLGTGDATVQAGSQAVNSGGVIIGTGNVTVDTSSLSNTQGGQLSGANVAVRAGNVDNSGGQIGTFAGSTGDVAIAATGAVTNTNGQIGATRDLAINAATLLGGGAYSAAHDVAVTVQGDLAPTADIQFSAGHDLAFTLPGIFSNGATLQAANDLAIDAGAIDNAGTMMAGGTLGTHSATLENAGAMVGASVSLNATQTLANAGPTALIGATDSHGTLELLAPDIENRDDTTATDAPASTAIFGLGNVVLAGGKNPDGSYTNAGLIRNQSALIQSGGDLELDADQVTNTRRVMTTDGAYTESVDPALIAQLGISLSGCTATDMLACGPDHPQVAGSMGDPSMIGGVPTDPPHGGQWNSTYQYTTYTGVALANLVTAISPQAQIIAGGDLDASKVSLFQNYWSAVAAAGNLAMPATLDQDSWRGQAAPGVQVTYSGQYHYDNYDNTEHNWQLPFGDAPFVTSRPGGYTQAAPADIRYYALPAYESTLVAGGTLSGTGVSIANTAGNAGVPSLGLAPGQPLTGVNVGGVNGGTGLVDPVIASATALNVLQNLTIPQGGLFRRTAAPDAPYLIETNPAFTSQKSFLSSDYYLQQLGLNPQTVEKRVGDGLYEQQLVQNQITSLTGKAVLGPYADLESMYQSLLAAGASLAGSLDLPLGMSLSPEQVAALTTNVIIMQTQVVDGQSVLVPVVYLASTSQQNLNGPLIAATDIDLKNTQTFSNSGMVQAGNTLSIQGQQIDNALGTLQSGGLMSLATTRNVDLTSATVKAGSLAVNAGGDLILSTAANTVEQVSATGATRTTTTLGPIANLNVAGDAAIVTGGNFEQNAGNLNVGGNLGLAVGGNYDLGAVQTGEHKVVERANGVSDTNLNSTTGSTVNVGGVSTIGVGGNLTATGADINLGGGGTVVAKGDVTLQAAKATSTVDSNSATSDHNGSYADSLHRSTDTLTATTLNAGDSLTVASGNDLNVTGSTINLEQGAATLAAANNVNIGAATATYVENSQGQASRSNLISGKQVSSSRDTTTTVSQGSTVSADAVAIASGNDVNVTGSTIVGTNDVALSAVHDVNITTSQDTMQSSGSYQEKRSGLGTSGLSVTVGSTRTATTDQESGVTNNGSVVGSLTGNLSIEAGNTLHVTGSDLVAAQNVTGTAANVVIDAATDTSRTNQTQQSSSSGLSIGLSGSIGDAINGAYQQGQAIGRSAASGNDRAAALHAIAAVGDAAMTVAGVTGGALMKDPSIGVQVSIGSSHSQSQSSEDQTIQRGSNVAAGGAAAFVATGDGTAGSGNVTIAGSNVNASDVLLAAKDQINIVNTTNTDVTRSSNASSGSSVGVSIGTKGVGVSASMQNAHGDGNSDAAIQNASHVTGVNGVTVVSGGDTSIIGSQVNGGQVTADIGGNLNVVSVQDTTQSNAHQSGAGGGIGITGIGTGLIGGSASFSAQNGHADGTYAQVGEQAGINAGSGGFDINVNGNTDLKGAVISSTADAEKNSLTTGTLTYSDIQNQSHYSANSAGISAGVGVGNTGKATGPGSVSGSGGGIPMALNESGDQSATTRSAVSAGTISITNQAAQTQDVSDVSRDTTNTNGTVSKTPDVNAILNQQADTMQAAQAAGQVVAQGIAAYANDRQETAQKAADAAKLAGDMDSYAKYQAEANSWAEGGMNRTELHIAGGALLGGLGGGGIGSAAAGAAGAGVGSALAGKLNGLADQIGGATGSMTLGNVTSNVLAGLSGAVVGGSMGAFTASNADLYNRSTGNAEGNGGTGSQLLDWIGEQFASAGRGAQNLANQFAALVNANGSQGSYVSPDDLNGTGGNSKPPTTGGSAVPVVVCVPPVCTVIPAVTPGTPGYVPGNVTLNSGNGDGANQPSSPQINPSDVAGKTAQDIAQHATDQGLIPKGPDPMSGRGAYVDPVTGQQRVLIHPEENCPHCHVNDSSGARLDINGNRVPSESPDAHLPLKK